MILRAKKLTKSYGKRLLFSDLDLSLETGESVAICGKSGTGKTTLLHILGTLENSDSGEVEICGEKVNAQNASRMRNQCIGFIFQSYNLLEDFTALENVLMPARIARKEASRQKGLELLERVGLLDKADLAVHLLSGGERQRVAIARGLCNDSKLLLADEPTGNLDGENGKMIGELLLSCNKALIIVTHDLKIASLCQNRYHLEDGLLQKIQ